jgi:hypothetical protein
MIHFRQRLSRDMEYLVASSFEIIKDEASHAPRDMEIIGSLWKCPHEVVL